MYQFLEACALYKQWMVLLAVWKKKTVLRTNTEQYIFKFLQLDRLKTTCTLCLKYHKHSFKTSVLVRKCFLDLWCIVQYSETDQPVILPKVITCKVQAPGYPKKAQNLQLTQQTLLTVLLSMAYSSTSAHVVLWLHGNFGKQLWYMHSVNDSWSNMRNDQLTI